MAGRTATIYCMDPRCTPASDSDKSSLKIRTAGAFIGGNTAEYLVGLLRGGEIEKVDIRQHTNCGAEKLVRQGLNSPASVDKVTYMALMPSFVRYTNHDGQLFMLELEDVSTAIQMHVGNKLMKHGRTKPTQSISFGRIATDEKVEGERTLLLIPPGEQGAEEITVRMGLNPKNTYVVSIVPGRQKRMVVDPLIAVRYIGTNNVVVSRGAGDPNGVIDAFWKSCRGSLNCPE